MVLASLFSSIILSNPNALEPRFNNGLRVVELFESEEECPEPSRLGVGVFNRERGRGRGGGLVVLLLLLTEPVAAVRGVELTVVAVLLLMGALLADAVAALVPDFGHGLFG